MSGLLPVVIVLAPPEAAAATTEWTGDDRAAVRLVTATEGVGSATTIAAGLEFRYGDGWHGYWRTPGDAGIAPMFDWSGSRNLAGADVSWPAPRRLELSGFQNAVYTGRFILPLALRLNRQGPPLLLRLALDYGACANVCVPMHADLVLSLPSGPEAPSAEAAELAAARARLPGTPAAAGLDIRQQSMTPDGPGRTLTLVLHSTGAAFQHPDLFVEMPGGGLAPPPEVTMQDAGCTATLSAPLTGPTAEGTVRLTFVDGERTAEIPAAGAATPITGSMPPRPSDHRP